MISTETTVPGKKLSHRLPRDPAGPATPPEPSALTVAHAHESKFAMRRDAAIVSKRCNDLSMSSNESATREATERRHGRVGVESDGWSGSRFRFELSAASP